jgi:hypothetical protein
MIDENLLKESLQQEFWHGLKTGLRHGLLFQTPQFDENLFNECKKKRILKMFDSQPYVVRLLKSQDFAQERKAFERGAALGDMFGQSLSILTLVGFVYLLPNASPL